MPEVELEFSLKVDGDKILPNLHYKLEDGLDQDFCDLVQDARQKLDKKMNSRIKEECGGMS